MSDVIPLSQSQPLPQQSPRITDRTPAIVAAQVPARDAAVIAGVGESTWWRLHSAGKVPRPNKLSGRTLWVVAELHEWIAAGYPDRRTSDAIKNRK